MTSTGGGDEVGGGSVEGEVKTESSGSAVIEKMDGENKKSITCRYYQQGNCFRGVTCWFKHDSSEITLKPTAREFRPYLESSSSQRSKGEPHSSGLGLDYDLDLSLESSVESCAICYEDKPATYGLLNNCSHSFCLKCIREWRSMRSVQEPSAHKKKNPHKGCPLCRVTSLYVIPSRFFYRAGLAKEACIERYRRSLEGKHCKYFQAALLQSEGSRYYCPFGWDCFYRHELADGSEYIFTETAEEMMDKRRQRRYRHSLQARLAALGEFDDEYEDELDLLAYGLETLPDYDIVTESLGEILTRTRQGRDPEEADWAL